LQLARFEALLFEGYSLNSVGIPKNGLFIDGSPFARSSIESISVEEGNEHCVADTDFVSILLHKLPFGILTGVF
jgi:hypothetical protein